MRAIGIILAGGNNNRMRELSNKRAIAAMPIAGSYRAIDFALSNMANTGLTSPLESCMLAAWGAAHLPEESGPLQIF